MEPIITSSNYRVASFHGWQQEFSFLYGDKDTHRALQTMWLMVVEDASQVGEGIRTNEYTYALDRIAHTFCWVLSFLTKTFQPSHEFPTAKVGFASIDDILWYKYPGVCYRCLNTVCSCGEQHMEQSIELWKQSGDPRPEQLIYYRQRHGEKPLDLAGWSEVLGKIYGHSHTRQSINEIAFHFLEEVGEVARALRQLVEYPRPLRSEDFEQPDHEGRLLKLHTELFAEVADTLSWMFSLTTKISAELQGAANVIAEYASETNETIFPVTIVKSSLPITLASAVWRAYKCENQDCIRCPICKHRPCDCSVASDEREGA